MIDTAVSPPARGRGLKRNQPEASATLLLQSPPARGRGLKLLPGMYRPMHE